MAVLPIVAIAATAVVGCVCLLLLGSKDAPTTTTPTKRDDDPYRSSRFVGHSLWLVPESEVLSSAIQSASQRFHTHDFVPHVTLVAALTGTEDTVVATTRTLATRLAPYEFVLRTRGLGYRDAFFQCVYAKAETTPSVTQANARARDAFPEKHADPDYLPHLSLVYGNFAEDTKKDLIVPFFESRLPESDLVLPVTAIEVWSTEGDVTEWYKVARIPLTGTTTPESSEL